MSIRLRFRDMKKKLFRKIELKSVKNTDKTKQNTTPKKPITLGELQKRIFSQKTEIIMILAAVVALISAVVDAIVEKQYLLASWKFFFAVSTTHAVVLGKMCRDFINIMQRQSDSINNLLEERDAILATKIFLNKSKNDMLN